MKTHRFNSELWLPVPPPELFPFFSQAENLNAITPSWLHFRILTRLPVTMQEGTVLDYRLRVRGLPLRWRTRINHWQPPHRFIDEQIRGPYRRWIHKHTFEARDGGTVVRDEVSYAVHVDFLVHRWLVRPDIERIFAFRSQALVSRFRRDCEWQR